MSALRRVRSFYATQFHLLRRWSGSRAAIARRILEIFAVSAIALGVTIWAIPGIRVREPGSVIVAALVLGALSALARPVLIGLLSGFSVIFVGIATLVLQTAGFALLSRLPGGFQIDGLWSAALASLVYSLIDALLAAGLSIGDDDSFFGTLCRQLAVRHPFAPGSAGQGAVVVQIDGLSAPVLRRELLAGRMPTLARWISGGMTLDEWQPLLPTQTSASQAGLLHRRNDGIPGFRWWEKETQRLLVSNHPADAHEIEKRVSDGTGLLTGGGASVGNLLSGDASRSYLTAATIDDPARELRRSHVLDWWFLSPYSYLRWIVLSVGEIAKEIVQAARARSGPFRGPRAFPYPFARAATNVLLRHLTTALVIEEMYRGAPVIYVDFVDYDEIAHHSGIDRVEAVDALRGVDRIIAVLEKAAADSPRRYRFVVLSDHGQSPGTTFRRRFGKTLEQLVDELSGDATVRGETALTEHLGRLGALDAEASPILATAGRRIFRGPPESNARRDPKELPHLVVAASGNLAHISMPRLGGRVDRETIDERFPGLIDGLMKHPGIGLVMVHSRDEGTLVLGGRGVYRLANDLVVGTDPVAAYGPHGLEGLRRIDAMPNCGDLVLISMFDDASGQVAPFEAQF